MIGSALKPAISKIALDWKVILAAYFNLFVAEMKPFVSFAWRIKVPEPHIGHKINSKDEQGLGHISIIC